VCRVAQEPHEQGLSWVKQLERRVRIAESRNSYLAAKVPALPAQRQQHAQAATAQARTAAARWLVGRRSVGSTKASKLASAWAGADGIHCVGVAG